MLESRFKIGTRVMFSTTYNDPVFQSFHGKVATITMVDTLHKQIKITPTINTPNW